MIKPLAAALSATFLLVTPPAHADTDTFAADLQAKGVPLVAVNGTPLIQPAITGPSICTLLHNGDTFDTAVQRFPPILGAWAPTIVSSAQHNICPDTLH